MNDTPATRNDVTDFVRELETAYAKEWSDDSARWIIDRIHAIGASDSVLKDAAIVIEQWHRLLPTPRAVRTSVAEAQARHIRDEQRSHALPQGAVETAVAPFLDRLYPGDTVTWDEHVRKLHAARADCKSSTCDIHTDDRDLAEVAS